MKVLCGDIGGTNTRLALLKGIPIRIVLNNQTALLGTAQYVKIII